MNSVRYTAAVGGKFHPDGSVRHYPGNTIICFGEPDSTAFRHARWIQEQLQALPFAHKLSLLPPSSFHMTVFELLCDEVRITEQWSKYLSLEAPLIETDEFFIQRMEMLDTPANFSMKYKYLANNPNGISIKVEAIDTKTEKAIRAYRDRLANITGIRFPNHEDYIFHISVAYKTIVLNPDEVEILNHLKETVDEKMSQDFGIFETGQPELTFFDDMHRFVPAHERKTLQSRSI